MKGEKSSIPASPSKDYSFADLTFGDAWILTKTFFVVALACTVIFVLPYLLLTGVELGLESHFGNESVSKWSKWAGISLLLLILYMMIKNLSDTFMWFSDLFRQLGERTKGMSFAKNLIVFLSLVLYVLLWQRYPKVAFFFSTLIFFPAGYTYDKYKRLLKKKAS